MNDPKSVSCPGCAGEMKLQIDRIDLGWAGDGPFARDLDFAGILADVYCCHACGRLSIRPVMLELPRPRRTAAA